MRRLGILGSTRGTNLDAIQNAILQQKLAAAIQVVVSNKADALILTKAKQAGLPAVFMDAGNLSRENYDRQVSTILKQYQVELVILIGYMRILSTAFIQNWQGNILNVHPSLLPKHAGLMDLAVHEAVLKNGEKETGCTVHVVTEAVDAGPIVLQKRCPVLPEDTALTLKSRVQCLEGEALIAAISKGKK